jgi:hypothetical protein
MSSFGRLWPHIAARRTWDQTGQPVWEFHFTPREARVRRPKEPRRLGERRRPKEVRGAQGPAEVVDSRGVQLGDLRIEEHRYRIGELDPDLARPSAQSEVAAALAELAANPESEPLRRRMAGRLAGTHEWLRENPGLDISSARITGQGLGEVFDGVFVWRAQGAYGVFIYLVAPDLQARALLVEDPELARALIQVACPRPGDRHADELPGRLQQAITRLGFTADPARDRTLRLAPPDAAAVLRVRSFAGTAGPADRPDPAGLQAHPGGPAKSESEAALSAELAELARKVGVRAVRRPSPSS